MLIDVPTQNKSIYSDDEFELSDICLALGTGDYQRVCRLFTQSTDKPKTPHEFIQSLDKTVKQQIATQLGRYGFNRDVDVDQVLMMGSAPYAWHANSKTPSSQIFMAPLAKEGPGKTRIFHLETPYPPSLLQHLAECCWSPELERSVVFSLHPKAQEEYYISLWESDLVGWVTPAQSSNSSLRTTLSTRNSALEGLAKGESYDHTWVWTTLFKQRWHSPILLAQGIEILLKPDSQWKYQQVPILKQDRFLPQALRRAGGIGNLRSIFSPPLAHQNFPNYEKQPLPTPQWLLEELPRELFAKILADLSIVDLLSLSKTDHWMNATLGGTQQSNKGFWPLLVKERFPALRHIQLPTDLEWEKVFREEIAAEFCLPFILCLDNNDLANTLNEITPAPLKLGRFLDRIDVALLRGPHRDYKTCHERAERFVVTERWAQLVTEGAMLNMSTAREWWSAVADKITHEKICKVNSRIDRQQFFLLADRFLQNLNFTCLSSDHPLLLSSKNPPNLLSSKDLPNLAFDQEKNAGHTLISYALLTARDPLYSTLETQLIRWFSEQNHCKEPTLAYRKIVDALAITLDVKDFLHNYEQTVLENLVLRHSGFPRLRLLRALQTCAPQFLPSLIE
ncbi:MAG: hypothetical protein AB7F31_07385 [Parachlamydiales bacterium]